MESIRHLLGFFLKISVAIFLLVLILWFVSSIPRTPGAKSGTILSSTTTVNTDLLPSPRTYSGFFSASGTDPTKPKIFVAPEPYVYNGPQPSTDTSNVSNKARGVDGVNGYSYTTYVYDGSGVFVPVSGSHTQTPPSSSLSNTSTSLSTSSNQTTSRSLYIRNLSIYEGGHVYTGLSFIGEARSTLFRDGKFQIVVVDTHGRVVGVSVAVATTQWSVPGWVRFAAKINYALPNNISCMMVFEEALTQAEKSRQPLRVPLPVICN